MYLRQVLFTCVSMEKRAQLQEGQSKLLFPQQ